MDGNKRTAHLFARVFLLVNNLQMKIRYKEAAAFIIEIADKKRSLNEIEIWIKDSTFPFNKKSQDHHFTEWTKDFGEK